MSIKITHTIKILRERFHAFAGISEKSLTDSLQIFRLFELREGETLTIGGGELPDRLYVALGRIAVTDGPGNRHEIAASSGSYMVLPVFPEKVTIEALDDAHLCQVDTELEDYLLTLEQVSDTLATPGTAKSDYIRLVRDSAPFQRIPLEYAEQALASFREQRVSAGEEIVRMGKEAHGFYVIVSGRAELWRIDDEEGVPMKAEELDIGATFGEEGLLTGKTSPVTVRMLEDGVLLELSRAEFESFLARPLVREVNVPVAKVMLDNGYVPLDVRLEEEFEEGHIPDSVLIPLSQLKKRFNELDRHKRYVAYCRSGRRSSVAAFILSQSGYEVSSMSGGVLAWDSPLAMAMH